MSMLNRANNSLTSRYATFKQRLAAGEPITPPDVGMTYREEAYAREVAGVRAGVNAHKPRRRIYGMPLNT